MARDFAIYWRLLCVFAPFASWRETDFRYRQCSQNRNVDNAALW